MEREKITKEELNAAYTGVVFNGRYYSVRDLQNADTDIVVKPATGLGTAATAPNSEWSVRDLLADGEGPEPGPEPTEVYPFTKLSIVNSTDTAVFSNVVSNMGATIYTRDIAQNMLDQLNSGYKARFIQTDNGEQYSWKFTGASDKSKQIMRRFYPGQVVDPNWQSIITQRFDLTGGVSEFGINLKDFLMQALANEGESLLAIKVFDINGDLTFNGTIQIQAAN